MKGLQLAEPGQRLSVLCLGAHSDDIEIGAGATLLQWLASGVRLDVSLVRAVRGRAARGGGARQSAADFLAGAERARIEIQRVPRRLLSRRSAPTSRAGSSSSRGASSPT